GGAIAERLAREGAAVALLSLHEPTRLLERLSETKVACSWSRCDVSSAADVDRAIAAVRDEYRGLDVVVNNAGYDTSGSFSHLSDEEWQKLIGVNLTGVMRVSRAALSHLEVRQGVIVNVTSASAQGGTPGLAAYSAVKSGVDGLTRSLAAEYARKGV